MPLRHTSLIGVGQQRGLSRLRYEPYQLIGKEGNDPEHEMEGHFLMPPHLDASPPELFLQPGVEPLGCRSFTVPGRFSGRHGDRVAPAGILVDNRNVSERSAYVPDG